MPHVTVDLQIPLSRSSRARQLEGMFDVPAAEVGRVFFEASLPYEEKPWSIGAILGPSGSGKTSVAKQLFGEQVSRTLQWNAPSVIDDFDSRLSMTDIANVCQAVGFNTIPAWMKPFRVLSNGEQFRVYMARRLLEADGLIVCDEFTSVVDRQVAKITSHAVQKYVRKCPGKQFVAVTCHYDIVDWLQPDWVYDVSEQRFEWRSLRRRPAIECTISRVPYSTWNIFAPYHYLTSDLSNSAKCFALTVNDRYASFCASLYRPHPVRRDIYGISRAVTLPDWQGLGLAFVLLDTIGAAYKTLNLQLHIYPAHPSFVRAADRSPNWALRKRPGTFGTSLTMNQGIVKNRPCAVFAYCGPTMNCDDAHKLIHGESR